MTAWFVCKNCHKRKPANVRLKGNQQYCSASECQHARKAAWQKEKMANDPNYRAQQIECLKKWRKKRPLDQYQSKYRQDHADYVEKNREKQRIRNKKRSQKLDFIKQIEKIVKMDTLKKSLEKTNVYLMKPYKMDASGKIVKMDELIVKFENLQVNKKPFFSIST